MKLTAKGPHGEAIHLSFEAEPSVEDVKGRIADVIGISSDKVKLWHDGTEVRGDALPKTGEIPLSSINYAIADDVFFMRINFEAIDDPGAPTKFFFFSLSAKVAVVRKWLAQEMECPPSELKMFLDETEVQDDEDGKKFEFKTLRFKLLVAGVRFVDKQQKPSQTVVVSATTYTTLADYAAHLGGVSEIDPGRITFVRNGKVLDKTEKMSELMSSEDPINIYEMVSLQFPDQRSVHIKIDWTASIQDVIMKIQRYFAMVVTDLRSEHNEVYPKTSLLRNVKKGFLCVTPEKADGHVFNFARGKRHFSLWIVNKELVDTVMNRILTIPWFMKLEKWDIEIEDMGRGVVMSSHAQFKDVSCVYRVKNKIATVSVTVPNGKVELDIASSATCAEVKRALIKHVDPTLKDSEVSLFSSHGKIKRGTKMRNCLTDERYYFVTERRNIAAEIQTPDGKRSTLQVSPRLHVFELKEKIKAAGILQPGDDIIDFKYQGRILGDDDSLYAVVYGKDKGVFYIN